LIKEDVVVSRDVVFDKSRTDWKDSEPINHDTDAIIPEQPSPKMPTAAQADKEPSSESDDELDGEPEQEPAPEPTPEPTPMPVREHTLAPEPQTRTSSRSNKGTHSTKFADEEYSQKRHTARIAKTIDPDNELEPQTYNEAVSHPTRGKQ
jgi:hypothetical protein